MIPLSAPLDDMDFDGLLEIARANLPSLAPEWTDYNYSDPGITLVELLAWIADTQIYAIGRDRADEQRQMARLLGIDARGARPAEGTVYPREKIGARNTVSAGTRLTPVGACAPRLEVAVDTPLWPIDVAAVSVETPQGSVDHTATNVQARASYPPFGDPPSRDAALRLVLDGVLDGDEVGVSLGFEIQDEAQDGKDALGGISVTHLDADGAETEVGVAVDTTNKLRRSGVMILKFRPVPGEQILLFRTVKDALMPRLLRITTNALPVVQRATFSALSVASRPPCDQLLFNGTGRPGLTLDIEPLRLFPSDEAADNQSWRLTQRSSGLALRVQLDEDSTLRSWRRGALGDAGPEDECYELTERSDGRIEIAFGNGINGRRPPASTSGNILVDLELSAGAGGNVAGGLVWHLDNNGIQWRNWEPIAGGRDPDDLDSLLARLRARLRTERTFATSGQIEEAAHGLSSAYGVARAAILEGWEPGRRRPASAATRTLLVTREGDSAETEDWCRAIARELRPRIPLAERLLVASPRWRELRVRVRAVAAPGRVPADVTEEIKAELADRLLPGGGKGAGWPLGQDVTAMAVGGWIRRLAGVAAVADLTLLDARGQPVAGGTLSLAKDELPKLVAEANDVVVETGALR